LQDSSIGLAFFEHGTATPDIVTGDELIVRLIYD
jgi:hypothetical protein